MGRKENQNVSFNGNVDFNGNFGGASAGGAITPGTGVSETFDRMRAVRHVRLTLSGFVIAVDEADDFGGTKLLDLPDSNLLLLMGEVDLAMVKGGLTNGLISTVDLDVGIGTAVASASTLATTMIDVFEKTDLDADALSLLYAVDTQAQSTAATPLKLADSATLALYLNVGLPVGITVSDTVTVSGTVDLYFVDLGNVNS
ncbi:MAG: hypothetical protein DRJ50_10720 [Actinobacteria bacterium]|nr:MAG: hypothetical protein DRJ50_10720 [Actinomycetota bacterium]